MTLISLLSSFEIINLTLDDISDLQDGGCLVHNRGTLSTSIYVFKLSLKRKKTSPTLPCNTGSIAIDPGFPHERTSRKIG